MRRLLVALSIAPLCILSGCAVLPEFEEDIIETAEIVRNIKCEFRDAAWQKNEKNKWLSEWNAAFVLTLSVNHKGGASADANLIHPLNVGNFNLPLTASGSGEATRTEKITFKEGVLALNADKDLRCPSDNGLDRKHQLLGGNIGIADLLDRTREAVRLAKISPSNLDYSLYFRIVKNGTIGPKFNVIPVGINTLTAGAKWEGSKEKTHTLTITLQENPPPCIFPELKKKYGTCPTFVVNLPASRQPLDGSKIQGISPETGMQTGPRVESLDKIIPKSQTGLPQKGISRDAQDSLDRALTRSILQDTLEEIRRRGITTP